MDGVSLELIGLFQTELAGIDNQFQFWLTITFAAVVASFIARDLLGTTTRGLLALGYLLGTALLALRAGGHVESAMYLMGLLSERGVDLPIGFSSVIGWLRRSVTLLGTIAALVFILRPPRAA